MHVLISSFSTLRLRNQQGGRLAAAGRGFKARTLVPALLALACLLAAPVTAQVNYAVSGNTAYVTNSPSASGDIVIASTYNGYPVTSIGDWAFYGCASLTSMTIPNSVTNIGYTAFFGCTSLTDFSADDDNPAYSSVDGVVFDKALTSLVIFPPGRAGSYVIPNRVTRIGHAAFYGCTNLTGVTIPNSVTSIGDWTFNGCTSLTVMTIPNSITNIGNSVFSYCTSLTSVVIGNNVTTIGNNAFSHCTSLTNVTIPNSVTRIWDSAFERCTSLTSVTIPNSVARIGNWAFDGCTSLTSVLIGNNVTAIGNRAFSYCTSLTGVTIPNSVASIGEQAFYGCTSLTSVVIGNSVTAIGDRAFSYCTSLTGVTIPNSVTSIGSYAFEGCTSLMDLSVEAANPAYSSLDGVFFNKAQTTLVLFPAGRAGSYVIPDSVTSIRSYAFYGCTSLASVTIPKRVTSIGSSVFYGCTSLTRLTIPASVINIVSSAFFGCTSLTNFTFLGNKPALSGTFGNVGGGATVYYYCGTTGWGPTYGGLPTVMLSAPISAGVKPGGFGFTLLPCHTNQPIVIEASTNLTNWQPIWTNTLPGASADFVDPAWLQHPARFYRARTQ